MKNRVGLLCMFWCCFVWVGPLQAQEPAQDRKKAPKARSQKADTKTPKAAKRAPAKKAAKKAAQKAAKKAAKRAPAKGGPAKGGPAKRAPAKAAPRKAPAKRVAARSPAKRVPAKRAPAKRGPAKAAKKPAKRAPSKAQPPKAWTLAWLAQRPFSKTKVKAAKRVWPKGTYAFKVGDFVFPAELFTQLLRGYLAKQGVGWDKKRFYVKRFADLWVDAILLSKQAARYKVSVSDQEVLRSLLVHPGLAKAQAQARLKSADAKKLTKSMLFTLAKARLLHDKVRQKIAASIPVSMAEMQTAFERQNTKVRVQYLRFSYAQFRPRVLLSMQGLRRYMTQNPKKIADYFRKNRKKFMTPPQIRARHILIFAKRGATPAQVAAARKKIDQILAMAKRAPSKFPALARKHSQGPSKTRGGDLGFFSKRAMVPPFSKAAFALKKPGDISPVVRTRFGFHIIQLVGRRGPQAQNLRSIRLRWRIAMTLFRKEGRLKKLRNQLRQAEKLWQGSTTAREFRLKLHRKGYSHLMRALVSGTGSTPFFRRSTPYIPGLGRISGALKAKIFATQASGVAFHWPHQVGRFYYLIRLWQWQFPDMQQLQQKKHIWRSRIAAEKEQQLLRKLKAQAREVHRVVYHGRVIR